LKRGTTRTTSSNAELGRLRPLQLVRNQHVHGAVIEAVSAQLSFSTHAGSGSVSVNAGRCRPAGTGSWTPPRPVGPKN
jgi:hypothetical protein